MILKFKHILKNNSKDEQLVIKALLKLQQRSEDLDRKQEEILRNLHSIAKNMLKGN